MAQVHGATIVDISEFHFDPSRVEFVSVVKASEGTRTRAPRASQRSRPLLFSLLSCDRALRCGSLYIDDICGHAVRWQVLGIGSFSCVHIATREDDGRKVAIKVFHHPVSRGLKSPSNSKHSGKAWLQNANKGTHTPIDARRRHFDPRRMKDEESDDYLRRDAESFKCEVSLLADTSLRHPHILAYLGHGFAPTESGGLAGFIVTEYIVGIDLYAYVRRAALSGGQDVVTGGDDRGISDPVTDLERPGPLTLPLIIKIGRQLATAIAHLHKHGVVHRDIKETNVMMTQASRDAILLDLGLAFRMAPASSNKAAGGTLERSSSTAAMQPTALTTTHELEEGGFGIRGYRAPEVLRHLPYTLAVDVFGFGRILINMLSSYHAPPKRYSLTALRARVIETFAVEGCCPRSLECWAYENIFCKVTCSQRWPRELQDLVRRCLSVTPASRPTMKDIASQLAQMSGGNGSTTRAATRPSKEAPDDAHVAQNIFPRIAE